MKIAYLPYKFSDDNDFRNGSSINNKNYGFSDLIFLFSGFICLFQKRTATKACMGNFSIKRLSDSKILKISFSILKVNIRRPTKCSE